LCFLSLKLGLKKGRCWPLREKEGANRKLGQRIFPRCRQGGCSDLVGARRPVQRRNVLSRGFSELMVVMTLQMCRCGLLDAMMMGLRIGASVCEAELKALGPTRPAGEQQTERKNARS
jgi:hypothetical protein